MYGNKKIDEIQLTNAIDLIWSTFLQFEAPNYSEEGIQSFKDFIDNKEILKRLESQVLNITSKYPLWYE